MDIENTAAALAAQFKHTSISKTAFYLNAAEESLRISEIRAALITRSFAKSLSTDDGICPSGDNRLRAAANLECVTCPPFLPVKYARQNPLPGARHAPTGLTRSWHDLDSDSALLAHFAALDEQLKS